MGDQLESITHNNPIRSRYRVFAPRAYNLLRIQESSFLNGKKSALTITSHALFMLLSGGLYGLLAKLSFEPFTIPILPWIALLPLFECAYRFKNSPAALITSGIVCTAIFNLCAFYWLYPATKLSLNVGPLYSVVIFALFTLTSSLKNVFLIAFVGIATRYKSLRFYFSNWLAIGLVATFFDGYCPAYIPWTWGKLIVSDLYLLQIAEYTGVYGLSLLVVSGNYYLFEAFNNFVAHRRLKANDDQIEEPDLVFPRRADILYWTAFPAVLFGIVLFGIYRLDQVDKATENLPVANIAAIQANSPLSDPKNMYEIRNDIIRVINETVPNLAQEAVEAVDRKLDMIALPESIVPFASAYDSPINRKWGLYAEPFEMMVKDIAKKHHVEIFLSELNIEEDKINPQNARGNPQNSSVIYSRKGIRGISYKKGVLFPMGEYAPLSSLVESIGQQHLLPEALRKAQFHPGNRRQLIPYTRTNDEPTKTEKGYFLPLICYEILFSSYVRRFFTENKEIPEYIVNITQDGWFGKSIATYQHMEFARVRAVETRRAVVRSTTSGVSVSYGPNGRIIEPVYGPRLTPQSKQSVQIWAVPANRGNATLYVVYGNLWMLVLGLIVAGLMLFRKRGLNKRCIPS